MTTPGLKSRRPQAEHSLLSPAPKTISTAEAGGKKHHFYKPLAKEFRRDGFTYRQIARQGHAAIYAQTWNGCLDSALCFEAIRIRQREGFEINGRFIVPSEVYPASKLWGVDAFTFTDKDAALAKFREEAAATQ